MIGVLGSHLMSGGHHIKEFMGMLSHTLTSIFRPPIRIKETFQQLFFVANGSLVIVVFCVCFAAMVTILESSFHMKIVIQNDSMVPGFAAMLILRELGSVVTALLLTSRVGAGMSAEVGLMKITEQVDALKMLGIDPVQYLVVPRLFACIIGATILTIVADITCIYSAFVISEAYLGFTPALFLTAMRRFVDFQDLIFSMIKGAAFGSVIPLISCYYGFRCKPGAEGVGSATTNSVVASSVAIIVIDFILSYIFSHFY
ncbi:MAG: ABC transporter permease [Oligoflexia bacterium]|nr:MAG: ABC transporter permease [Oligoflexia bacterium]